MPVALLLYALACTDSVEPTRPNILVVTLDTTRADVVGAYGTGSPATPTFDALAAVGATLTRAYTVTPLTIPAHASLHTGLLPPRHGIRDNGDFFLDDGARTLAETLREAGYSTMASVGAEVTSHHWGFGQGFDAYFDDMGGARASNRWRVERRGDAVVDDALGWLTARTGPWFAWVHLFDAHHPYEAPEAFAARFPDHPYLAEVAWADHQLGRLLDTVDDTAWVLVLADHGESLGAHGEAMHGVLLYDTTTRIPWVLRSPAGQTLSAELGVPTSIVDVMPTVLSAAGLTAPVGLDGRDLLPWLTGTAPTPTDRAVYVESLYANRHYGWAVQRALVEPELKLIDSTTPELYRRVDRAEAEDLATRESETVARLHARLESWAAAMAPEEQVSSEAVLSQEVLGRLAALGYLTGEPAASPSTTDLPDPVDRLPVLALAESSRQALQAGDLHRALEQADQALAQDPGLWDLSLSRAWILLELGELDRAREAADALDRERSGVHTRWLLGAIHLQRGDLQTAMALLTEAIEADPYLEAVWVLYLQALAALEDPPLLVSEAERAAALLPESRAIQGFLGLGLVSAERPEEARPRVLAALEEQPDALWMHHALGLVELQGGSPVRAEAAFQEEVRLHAPAIPSRRRLVELLASQRRYAEQLEQLAAIASSEPPSVLTAHSRAQALFNLGRFQEAEVEVMECIGLAPDYPACAMLQANVLKRLGREAEAQEAYRRALELAENL